MRPQWWRRVVLLVAAVALGVLEWIVWTTWEALVHGHPAYPILLALTFLAAIWAVWRWRSPRTKRSMGRKIVGVLLVLGSLAGIGVVGWLRPHPAVEPALKAMVSDESVTVTETPTRIVMEPGGEVSPTGVFFQPGALVDARAYAATLRPLAEAGHRVVITKQPLGIAFFSLGDFDQVRDANNDIDRWVVAGHSLGGTVASMQANRADGDATGPAVGLLLWASYPAGDVSDSLTADVESISGSRDGLATPTKIDASRADLPASTEFVRIEGASHAQFGDYGAQAGDSTPQISDDEARSQISDASLGFVQKLAS